MPKNPTIIQSIDASFEDLTKASVINNEKVANLKPFDRKALRDKATGVAQKSGQLELPLFHSIKGLPFALILRRGEP